MHTFAHFRLKGVSKGSTPAIDEIITIKNVRAWVSMVSIKFEKKYNIKEKKNPGSRLGFAY